MYSASLKTTNAYGSDGIADAAQYTRVSLRPKMLEERKKRKKEKTATKKVEEKKKYCIQ